MASPIIPFGKYKGQPAEVLLQDDQYTEWLRGQDWFAAKYQAINVFITNHGEPNETPEHNALQAKFLDQKFLRRVLVACGQWVCDDQEPVLDNFEVGGSDVIFIYPTPPNSDGSPSLGAYCGVEVKPSLGDDYPAVLRKMAVLSWGRMPRLRVLLYDRFSAVGATAAQVREIFRLSGIYVISLAEVEG